MQVILYILAIIAIYGLGILWLEVLDAWMDPFHPWRIRARHRKHRADLRRALGRRP